MTSDRGGQLQEIQDLLREILTYRPSILDGTVSCRICRALVLEENSSGHQHWHDEHRRQHTEHYTGVMRGGV